MRVGRDAPLLWRALSASFRSRPRVVLAACLHALKDPAGTPFPVACAFVEDCLLAPSEAESGRGGAGSEHAGGDNAGGSIGNGERAGGCATLAESVLRPLPAEQRWLRLHVAPLCGALAAAAAGSGGQGGGQVLRLLNRLLSALSGGAGDAADAATRWETQRPAASGFAASET